MRLSTYFLIGAGLGLAAAGGIATAVLWRMP
jgi:hypothetical protein